MLQNIIIIVEVEIVVVVVVLVIVIARIIFHYTAIIAYNLIDNNHYMIILP